MNSRLWSFILCRYPCISLTNFILLTSEGTDKIVHGLHTENVQIIPSMLYILPGSVHCIQCTDNTVHFVFQGVYSLQIILYMVYIQGVYIVQKISYMIVYIQVVYSLQLIPYMVYYTLYIYWKGRINIIVFLFSKSITGLYTL